mgnify:CR=1 FL=1
MDTAIGIDLDLGAELGVEVAAEQRCEVAELSVAEQQFLRVHRTGGIHIQVDARRVPRTEAGDRIWVDVAMEVPLSITRLPNHPL